MDNGSSRETADLDPDTLIESMNTVGYDLHRVVVPAWSGKIISVRAPSALLAGHDSPTRRRATR